MGNTAIPNNQRIGNKKAPLRAFLLADPEEVKRHCKGFDFNAGMLKGSLVQGWKKL